MQLIDNSILVNALELRVDNPYSLGEIQTFPDDFPTLERNPLIYKESPNDEHHTIVDGDNLWNLAYKKYGNSKYAWMIWDVNSFLDNYFELPIGEILIIPDFNSIIAINQ